MTRMPTWAGVLMVCALAFALTACKSRTRRAACNDCAPPTLSSTQPPIGNIDSGTFTDSTTFPPAPSVPSNPAITQADLDAANDRADREAQMREAAEAQIRTEQDRLADQRARIEELENKVDELGNAPAFVPQEEPVLVQSTGAEQLIEELRAQSSAEVLREGDLVIVRVTNGFQAGSDLLRKDVRLMTTLNATANALGRYPAASVSVVGHSDSDPIKRTKDKWANNDQLSLARAQRVASVLASNGVDSNRISIDGRGAREPLIAPERSRSDKATNRRVEIMIRL